MLKSPFSLSFPFTEKVMEDAPADPEQFQWVWEGKGALSRLENGLCIAKGLPDGRERILFFFQRKPYSAGMVSGPGQLAATSIREFFSAVASAPACRLDFLMTDPILLKSLLVLVQKIPQTGGSAEVLKLTGMVIDLMEAHKDALMAVIQGNRYGLVFVKAGKIVKAYFSVRMMQSQSGMDWTDLFEQIEMELVKGEQVIIQLYEDLATKPAVDYLGGQATYAGGVFRYYTRPMPEIIVRFEGKTLRTVSVPRYPFVIGRAEEADLTLNDPGISRRHAALEETGGHITMRDLDSLNGIFVNDRKVRQVFLSDGDRVTLGGHALQIIFPRPARNEDVVLPGMQSADATVALGPQARVRVQCPSCRAAGSMDAAKFYRQKDPRVRCPRCGHTFPPASGQG